jgi:adenosine deaminase
MFRDEPRKLDDIMRWASSATAVKGGVVGIGLVGREVRGWVEEFERPFRTAQKKGLARGVESFDTHTTILETLQRFEPERLISGAAAAEDEATMQYMSDKRVALNVCMAQSIATGKAASYTAFPLKQLYDDGAVISLGVGMPSLYRSTLNQQYLAAIQEIGLSLAELEMIGLNAISASFMADEEKAGMLADFKAAYANLRVEHEVVADTAL